MKKIIFIADFFANETTGGAELHDDVLINYFIQQGIFHEKINSHNVNKQYVEANRDKVWIFGNFTNLSFDIIPLISKNIDYLIYEHDYKFLDVRNPILFTDFVAPKRHLINLNFYKMAKKVICISKMHYEIFQKNLGFENIVHTSCSMWSNKDLSLFEDLLGTEKNDSYAIIDSNNPIKKRSDSILFCEKNSLKYVLIKSNSYHEFIKTLSKFKGLVFMTGHPEPTPRVAIECKMLGLKFISQKKLISVAHEDYFHLEQKEMIEKVREMRDENCNKILEWCMQ